MYPEHPSSGPPHPWTDPLLPAHPLDHRPPDWAFEQAGPMPAPRPEDFPFTDEGRRDYYMAVERAATTSAAMHHQMAAQAHGARHQQQRQQSGAAHSLLLIL